jgi:1-deoxy-D-xylulose-5-phosphate reductoisomerase
MSKKVLILGSTGSIGTATLEVIANAPAAFEVCGLACRNNIDLLNEQITRFKPRASASSTKGRRARSRHGAYASTRASKA